MSPRMWKGCTVALALAALAAGCGRSDNRAAQPPDSVARNLTLVPNQSGAQLSDTAANPSTPAAAPAPAGQPAPAPAPAPSRRSEAKPAPVHRAPAGPASYTAASGTHVALSVNDTISSRTARAGQDFTAKVRRDVKDAAGHVVIPAGSTVSGTVTEVKPGDPRSEGTLTLAVSSVTVNGRSYPIEATIESATTIRQGRGVTGKEAAKVGIGAAAGAIAGRIIGHNTRGTVIGGVVGAAAGAGVAAATRSVDIVLPAGGEVDIALSKPVTVPVK